MSLGLPKRGLFLILLGVWLPVPFVVAQDLGIEAYPNATLVSQVNEQASNHQLVTGSIKKINGVVRADSEFRVNGQLARKLYQIPEGHTNQDAFEFTEQAILAKGYKTLYRCQGRRCGSSNFWANEVFNIKQLYGRDNAQFYLIAENESLLGDYLLTYAILRGNGRVFSLVEHFETDQARQARIQSQHYIDVPGWPSDVGALATSSGLEKLVTIFKERSDPAVLVVSIAGDSPTQSDLNNLLAQSGRYAEAVKQQLVGRGVDGNAVMVLGVGPALFPAGDPGTATVRVLLQ
ncbi:DUF4892 domain-containing protein [Aestuariirhabdus sp. Z084]|uniref:DUF4892 domain-containing protein n=1 Tax=Aestuariirhabdus haliotis TaxID=2918751 RepID=UPI00201B391D|nr:DUF4892 domain-containing protein [Aestuariirhabdus haliotis]MCL6414529.1 DUF4892 domain-containing protein [Aestuariirhabdus haliotis]MCL6418489.1 DUF4892 domain-containing protein [Aestuariirhabdus haliotis]